MARLTVGIPVYNSEKYISEALESLANQSYKDMDIIISDNASTDRTFDICCEYSRYKSNVFIHRNEKNLGASANFNLVFNMSNSEYFKWASYDDICDKEFLKRCIEVLDADKEIVLCHSKTKKVDQSGTSVGVYSTFSNTMSDKYYERFQELIVKKHSCVQIFGVFRSNTLKKTHLIGSYLGSDRVLLSEVGLQGKIYEIPDPLFSRRDHPSTTMKMSVKDRLAWFDPKLRNRLILPNFKILYEHIKMVYYSELSFLEKGYCLKPICIHMVRRRNDFLNDLKCLKILFGGQSAKCVQ